MKIRNDSPFVKLTEDQREKLLTLSKSMTIEQLVEVVKGAPEPIHCSLAAMRKFIKRLEKEQRLECIEQDADLVEMMSKRAANPAVREATMQTMRERMFDVMFESNNRESLMETYRVLKEEKDEERAAALEERRIKMQEENTKIAWRKLELENARAGLKALPRVREVLMDANKTEGERISAALQLLSQMAVNPLLLVEPTSQREAVGLASEPKALPTPTTPESIASEEVETERAPVPANTSAAPQPFIQGSRIGRNELCPCGSGKKYKRCCEGQQATPMRSAA